MIKWHQMKFTSLLIFTKAMSLLKVFFTKFGCMNTLMRKTTPKLFFNKTSWRMRKTRKIRIKKKEKNTLSINLCCWCASSRRRSWSPRINRILSGLILTITLSAFIILSINSWLGLGLILVLSALLFPRHLQCINIFAADYYPFTQWAAVMTQSGLTMVPPHMKTPSR